MNKLLHFDLGGIGDKVEKRKEEPKGYILRGYVDEEMSNVECGRRVLS